MRLDSILVAAPVPDPAAPLPRLVSRRMFAVGMLAGAGLGATLGALAGRSLGAEPDPEAPSDDAGLGWALRAQDGPLAELAGRYGSFLMVYAATEDRRLLRGIERLVFAVLEDDPELGELRAPLASDLVLEIEARATAGPLLRHTDALRRVR